MSEFNEKYNEVKNWFEKYQQAHQLYSQAYGIFNNYILYKSLLDKIPETENNLKINMEGILLGPISIFKDALGPSLNIDVEDIKYSGATASSGSANIINTVQTYNAADPNWLAEYRNGTYKMINEIQKKRESVEFISENLSFVHPPLGVEFNQLVDMFEKYISTIEYSSSFGIKIRNIIEHFKGICNKCAVIKKNGEFKKTDDLTWNQISEFIAINGKGSRYDNEFKKNISIYTKLHTELSKDAKDYETSDIEKLKELYTMTIEYLESSIKLINLTEIKNAL
jgi:hypothetical protein